MLIDATLAPSRMQQGLHGTALVFVAILICTSGLAWFSMSILIGLLLVMDRWWFKAVVAANRIQALWQGDSQRWYWQQQQGQRDTGQLLQVRYLGLLVHLSFNTSRNVNRKVTVWRDQVAPEQWRRLCVLAALKDSQQNLF